MGRRNLELTYKAFASPLRVLIPCLIMTGLLILIALISFPPNLTEVIIFSMLIVIELSSNLLRYRDAYVKFEMSDDALKNKILELRWEDISDYKILENSLFKYSGLKIQLPSIVCFFTNDAPTPGYIFALNQKYHVWFEITPKNLKELRKYNQNRSEVINRLLDEVDSWHTGKD